MMSFTVGMKGVRRLTVAEEDTAYAVGNTGVYVLSTPRLILLCEMACHDAIVGEFAEGMSSVGVHNDIYHLAATPMGGSVEVTATLTEIDRRKLTFEVTGHDERNQVVNGVHKRVLVDLEAFLAGLMAPRN